MHEEGDICPKCYVPHRDGDNVFLGKADYLGRVVKKSGKFGTFFGCSKFPECKWSAPEKVKDNAMRNAMWDIPRPY